MRRAGARGRGLSRPLIRQGFRVAVCEQMEDPAEARKRGGKSGGAARRGAHRHPRHHHRGAPARRPRATITWRALAARRGGWRLASPGSISRPAMSDLSECARSDLGAASARLAPGEILLPERLLQKPGSRSSSGRLEARLSPLARAASTARPPAAPRGALGVETLDGFGAFSRAEIAAAGSLVDYVDLHPAGQAAGAAPPPRSAPRRFMAIDPATRRNLELTETLAGERAAASWRPSTAPTPAPARGCWPRISPRR